MIKKKQKEKKPKFLAKMSFVGNKWYLLNFSSMAITIETYKMTFEPLKHERIYNGCKSQIYIISTM